MGIDVEIILKCILEIGGGSYLFSAKILIA
jgi:hypothetical protein